MSAALFILSIPAVAAITGSKTEAKTFGPQACVSVSRSSAGSCVLATKCEGEDLSGLEFAFDCITPQAHGLESVVRHSFGVGGFDAVEVFDSEVACDKCSAPVQPIHAHASTQSKNQALTIVDSSHEANVAATAKIFGSDASNSGNTMAMYNQGAVSFGPDGSISTSRSISGTCVIQTHCEDEATTKNYDVQLGCEDADGTVVFHSFGKNSFDPEETFDSLIPCEKCLAPPAASLAATQDMAPLTTPTQANLTMPEPVAPAAPAAAPVAAPAAAPAASVPPTPRGMVPAAPPAAPAGVASPPVFYGPNSCVSTYRAASGTCVMKTQCTADDIDGYMFGLVCMEKQGSLVRHLFGKDSFEPEETFDTLVVCDQCLGLQELSTNADQDLIDEVKHLKATVGVLADDVKELKAAVFKQPVVPISPVAPIAALRHRNRQHQEQKLQEGAVDQAIWKDPEVIRAVHRHHREVKMHAAAAEDVEPESADVDEDAAAAHTEEDGRAAITHWADDDSASSRDEAEEDASSTASSEAARKDDDAVIPAQDDTEQDGSTEENMLKRMGDESSQNAPSHQLRGGAKKRSAPAQAALHSAHDSRGEATDTTADQSDADEDDSNVADGTQDPKVEGDDAGVGDSEGDVLTASDA